MTRNIKIIDGGRHRPDLVLVTTSRSILNPLNWFRGAPLVNTVAYKKEGDSLVDLHGNSVPPEISQDILDKLGG